MSETCVNHPDKPAAGKCAGCGRSFCYGCAMVTPDGNLYCRPCAHSGAGVKKVGPGNMAILAFILSIAGFTNCATAIAGIVLGAIELKKIDRGESPEEGRKYARWAIIIGAVVIALLAIYLIVYVSLFINGVLKA
ncbi:MAG: DUF4190 domain-containing protein [Thermoleophilia bacterium]